MSLEQSAVPTFAAHQTFHPRFGWIKKGYDAAVRDPDIFNKEESPVILGVGKNMVEAIRTWSCATHVVVRIPNPARSRMSIVVPTPLGRVLLDDREGLDPYLEDLTTLWILHWQAVSAVTSLPVWWAAFNDLPALEFAESDLMTFCVDEIATTRWPQPNKSSIQKDVDCLLRMYTKRNTRARQTVDELLDSPFRELGLIRPAPAGRDTYRFVRGAKPGLSSAAIAYACLDYMAATDPDGRTVSIARLATDPGSPGRLLKVPEELIQTALEEVVRGVSHIRLAAPAGAPQLVIEASPAILATTVLWLHHRERRPSVNIPRGELAGPAARAPAQGTNLHTLRPTRRRNSVDKGSAA